MEYSLGMRLVFCLVWWWLSNYMYLLAKCDFNDVISAIYNYNGDSLWLMPDKDGGWEGPKWQPASPICLNWPETEVRSVHFFSFCHSYGVVALASPLFCQQSPFCGCMSQLKGPVNLASSLSWELVTDPRNGRLS